jgi:hypothetical protein
MVIQMEEDREKEEQDDELEGTGSWLKDNLRIIVSIIIVIAIAGGVYSYSKRNQSPAEKNNNAAEEQTANEGGSVEVQNGDQGTAPAQTEQSQPSATQKSQVAPAGTSQETEGSFIETAGKGDSQTRLARRALANYLEKNPDSGLTAEHKIYIEDFLRKNSGSKGHVRIGTSVEFSKDLIGRAIGSSKKLNDKQLKNLHKYAVRVPSLS